MPDSDRGHTPWLRASFRALGLDHTDTGPWRPIKRLNRLLVKTLDNTLPHGDHKHYNNTQIHDTTAKSFTHGYKGISSTDDLRITLVPAPGSASNDTLATAPSSSLAPGFLCAPSPAVTRTRTRGSSVSTMATTVTVASTSNTDYEPSLRRWESSRPSTRPSASALLSLDVCESKESNPSRVMDPLAVLPPELRCQVLAMLEAADLDQCRLVSRAWYDAASADTVWHDLYDQRLHWKARSPLPSTVRWRDLYQTRCALERRWRAASVSNIVGIPLAGHSDSVYCAEFSDRYIITGSRDRTARVWDAQSGELLRTLGEVTSSTTTHHTGSILALCFNESILVTGSGDGTCIVWDMTTFAPLRQVRHHSKAVMGLCIATDGEGDDVVVSCSKDGTIVIWSPDDRRAAVQFTAHQGAVNAVQVVPTTGLIASVGGDSDVKLWTLGGELKQRFEGPGRGVACVGASLCGSILVSGGKDYCIRVWDRASGQCRHVLEGHEGLVRCVHVTGDFVVSGSYDQTIRIWDLHSGRLLKTLQGWHGSWIFGVRADCKSILTTSFGINPVVLRFTRGLDPALVALIRA